MIRPRHLAGITLLAALVATAAAFTAPAPAPSSTDLATIGSIANQLGVKVSGRQEEEFSVGVQFTGNLVDPAKLEAFGIRGMNEGARVVAARIAPDRVFVEADELDPPKRASARLPIGSDGKLARPPKV